MADFLQTLIIAVTLGSLYALIALGYTMVYGILKLINFAHSDVVVLGAWITFTLSVFLLPTMGVDLKAVPWWGGVLVLVLAMTLCAGVGLAIERFAYKPIRRAPRLNALITAIGVSLLLQNVGQLQVTVIPPEKQIAAGNVTARPSGTTVTLDQPVILAEGSTYVVKFTTPAGSSTQRKIIAPAGAYEAGKPITLDTNVGNSAVRQATYTLSSTQIPLRLPFGPSPVSPPKLLPENVLYEKKFESTITLADGSSRTIAKPLRIGVVDVLTVATAAVLMIALEVLVFHTRFGQAMRAVSFNTDFASLMGIPIDRVISITFALGAALAAAAGFLYAQSYASIQQPASYAWVLLGLKAFIAAVVGGIGNLRGATLGAFLIAFIERFNQTYGSNIFPNLPAYTDVMVFGLLIVVLLVKPSGILGSSVAEKV